MGLNEAVIHLTCYGNDGLWYRNCDAVSGGWIGGRAGAVVAGELADRVGHRFSRGVRIDGRGRDAGRGRVAAHGSSRDRCGGGARSCLGRAARTTRRACWFAAGAVLKRVPGVAAVLSANPYYNKPTQEGQFQHFLALAREVDPLPVCVYNVPGRTAANLEPETVARLAAAAKNIEAIKEASGKADAVCRAVASSCRAASRFFRATTTWRWRRSPWARMD
jgi:hypothetical protein